MLVNALVVSLLLSAPEKPKLAVLELQALGTPPETALALSDAMTQELTKRGFFDVVSSRDIKTLLGVERQKALLGCGEEASSCVAELAGALGSRFVMSGSLSKLGDAMQLSIQTLDTTKGQPLGRSVRMASNAQELVAQLPWALAEATATTAPPQPSRVLSFTLGGVGAAALVAGTVLGVDAFSKDFALEREMGEANGVFRPLATYRQQASDIGVEKTAALVAAVVGVALLAGAVWALPGDTGAGGGGSAVLVPTGNGLALVGVLP